MNKLVEWSDELSVGIQEIDEQHKVLVGLVNELHDAMQHRRGAAVTGHVLNRLNDYTRIHFAVEESLMRILGYPHYEQHKQEHEDLIRQLADIRKKFESKERSVSFDLMHLLKVWMTRHIMETDMRYSPYFLARGVQPQLPERSWTDKLWQSISFSK